MERQFPDQYSKPLQKVLKAVSFGTPNVVGSSADHKIMYSADYDLIENVILSRGSTKKFQEKVRKIQKVAKIVDIKCGEVSEWNLLKKPYVENGKVKNYKQEDELKHLSALWQNKIVTHDEYMSASDILKPHLDAVEFLNARKELRFGLLRWTVAEVLRGYKELRDNSIYYLDDAFKSKGITKLDLIAWITNKYVEISNVIVWVNNNKPYAYIPAIKKALKENILEYEAEGNYIKVAKRMYSLAKQYKDASIVDELTNILNSPIGKLYMVTVDMEVLEEFPTAVTQARKRKELDTLKNFFAKLFFPELDNATPNNTKLSYLKEILQARTKEALEEAKLLPIPRDYMI
jgi:hypothetical protein